MSDVLRRIARELTEAQKPRADRAFEHLLAVSLGDRAEIGLSDYDLVLGIREALWLRELVIAQMALGELEIRTAADADAMEARRAA